MKKIKIKNKESIKTKDIHYAYLGRKLFRNGSWIFIRFYNKPDGISISVLNNKSIPFELKKIFAPGYKIPISMDNSAINESLELIFEDSKTLEKVKREVEKMTGYKWKIYKVVIN